MGLDTTHDCWHGAYSAFTRWRNKLAEVAGYAFYKAGDPPIYDQPLIDWGHITTENSYGQWANTPPDPLIVLIAHSDCEGEIYPAQAGPLADRLEELLPLLPSDSTGGHIGVWKDKTQAFINGLRAAVAANEPVEFH